MKKKVGEQDRALEKMRDLASQNREEIERSRKQEEEITALWRKSEDKRNELERRVRELVK